MKLGTCRRCGREKMLHRSHIIARCFSKQMLSNGEKPIVMVRGRYQPGWQQGVREELLCEECEQDFSRTEKAVAENLTKMVDNARDIECGPPGRLQWRRRRRVDSRRQIARKRKGRPPRLERWTGVDGRAWKKLAAITAWRAAASSTWAEELTPLEPELRWIMETGEWRGQEPWLLCWVPHLGAKMGKGPKDRIPLEHMPMLRRGRNIRMAYAGIAVELGIPPATGIMKEIRNVFDITAEGTWAYGQVDLLKQPNRQWIEKAFGEYLMRFREYGGWR